jgi:hypothetical protein
MHRPWIGRAFAPRLSPAIILTVALALSAGLALGQEPQEPQKPPDQPAGPTADAPKPAPDPAVLRTLKKSLFVPGWGQAAEKRWLEAAVFFGAEAGCLAAILVNNHSGNKNYDLYKAASTSEDAVRYRALTERYDTRRNGFIAAAAVVWALNLLDTYLIVHAKGGKAKTLRLGIETGAKATLALSLRFGY